MDFQLYTIQSSGIFTKSYEIFNEKELVYTAKAKSFFRGITISDLSGNKLLEIKKETALFKSVIKIKEHKKDLAIIKKPIFSQEFEITTNDGFYLAKGNLFKTHFTFFQGEEEVAKISRLNQIINQKYGLAVKDHHNGLLFIALTLALDFWMRRRKAKS